MTKHMVITLSLDPEPLSGKPDKTTPEGVAKVELISKRVVRHSVDITLENLIAEHTEKARTIAPAVFNKGSTGKVSRKNTNWRQQQLFMLDIDNEIEGISIVTVEDALGRCAKYDVKPFFIYHSMSSTLGNERFRMGFLYDQVVTNPNERDMVQDLLQMLFPEADNTKDRARMFYGSHSGAVHIDYDARVDLPSLFISTFHFRKHVDPSHYRRSMERLIRRYSLSSLYDMDPMEYAAKHPPRSLVLRDDDFLTSSEEGSGGWGGRENSEAEERFILGENSLPPIDNMGTRKKSPILDFSSPTALNDDVKTRSKNEHETNFGSRVLVKNFNFDLAREKCNLLDLLLNKTEDLSYNENYLLTLNLIQIEGGQRLLLDSISKRAEHLDSEYDEKERYLRTQDAIDFAKANGYNAKGCSDVCRFYANGQCQPSWYSICQINADVGYRVIEASTEVSPVAARNSARLKVQDFVEAPNQGQTLAMCSPPGLGKTNDYKDIEGALIVVPTHRLAREVKERSNNPNAIVVPELPLHVLPRETQAAFRAAHAKGAHKTAVGIIHSANKNNKYPEITKYLELVEQSKRVSNTVIITHERYLIEKDEYPHDLVIIDEDIARSAYSCKSITMFDLQMASSILTDHRTEFSSADFAQLQQFLVLLGNPDGNANWRSMKTPAFSRAALDSIDTILGRESTIRSNVIGLFNSAYYTQIRDSPQIWYIQSRDVKKEGAKTLSMSATLPKVIAEVMFGTLDYYDAGNVRTAGTIVQFREKSFSRDQLGRSPGILQKLAGNLKMPVITYKDYKSDLGEYASHMHFGNTEGLNDHTGQDIVVVGTPNRPFPVYLLMATLFGLAEEDKEYSDAPVTKTRVLNGIESKFTAVGDEGILQVQNYMILSDLIQAIGRARIIDNEVTVYLFTNWPVPNTVLEEAPDWLYNSKGFAQGDIPEMSFDECYGSPYEIVGAPDYQEPIGL